ncbi:MAG: hypothetical protein HC861_09175 [Rhodospirillaceae bacterium]|nr:hypothetical protein [Rhodospirillaceae bacterium]
MPGFPVGIVLGAQLYFIWTWRGIWRWLAAPPLLMIVAFVMLIPVWVSFEPRIVDSWLLIVELILYTGPPWLLLLGLTRLVIRWATVF